MNTSPRYYEAISEALPLSLPPAHPQPRRAQVAGLAINDDAIGQFNGELHALFATRRR